MAAESRRRGVEPRASGLLTHQLALQRLQEIPKRQAVTCLWKTWANNLTIRNISIQNPMLFKPPHWNTMPVKGWNLCLWFSLWMHNVAVWTASCVVLKGSRHQPAVAQNNQRRNQPQIRRSSKWQTEGLRPTISKPSVGFKPSFWDAIAKSRHITSHIWILNYLPSKQRQIHTY